MLRSMLLGVLLALPALMAPASSAGAAVRHAHVAVAVAGVWTAPRSARPLDRPALARPVNMRLWLSRLSTERRRGLVGRLQTQALYGAPVVVTARSGAWSRVAVVHQRTPRSALGYPGWLPTRQLTFSHALSALARRPLAVVQARSAWLRGAGRRHRRLLRLSFGTELPVLGQDGAWVTVASAAGERRALRRSAVQIVASRADMPAPSGRRLLRRARRFLGLRYLWAGTSSWGFDCSGLTYAVFRSFGIGIPRDADRQALHGRPVARGGLRRGDLVFFTGGGTAVSHVGIYAGHGRMLESPDSAGVVQIVPLALRSGYAGARRYLPG